MKAFVFPGQGAQHPGMGRELCESFAQAKIAFEEASDAISVDLKKLCFDGSDADLKLTENTQPCILTVSIAALRALYAETGAVADVMAGHSLGEITALVASGAIGFADGVRLVRKRGRFMQEAVEPGRGAMAALVGMNRAGAEQVVKAVSTGIVEVANVNSEEQVAISGEKAAVEEAGKIAKEKGAKRVVMLEVSAPFHCSMMKPAAEKFAEALREVRLLEMRVPVVTNLEARANSDSARIPELLTRQIYSPVLWLDSVVCMKTSGVEKYVELGPGRVLSGLIRRIDKNAGLFNVEDSKSLKATNDALR
jgi:[acyl-carrier-protein] S-malonyltransferase